MNILEEIVENKRLELVLRKREVQISVLENTPDFRRKTVSLRASLNQHLPFAIIAEIKRSSPSAGAMNTLADPAAIAAEYEQAGAAAISVLTDSEYFGGSIDDVATVRTATKLPILRKEFIIDHYQITEARAFGADAVLLIASVLEKSHLAELHAHARQIGLEVLVEVHDAVEIQKVDFHRTQLLGINNRNLKTMQTDIEQTFSLAKLVPDNVTIVSESGISSASMINRLLGNNVHAGLIGEHFMKSGKPGESLRSLLNGISA